jgi:putative ABC transport system permease protein
MIRFWPRFWRAELHRGKSLTLLAVLGVALGVASVLSIQILSANALSAFRGSARAVSGESDFTVVGNAPTLPESLLVPVWGTPGVAAAWPVYRASVAVERIPDLRLDLLGVDLLSPGPWPVEEARSQAPDSLRNALATRVSVPGWVAVTPELAAEEGWAVGDSIRVSQGSTTRCLRIGALVDFRKASPLASRRLAVMDIASAQAFFGERGRVSEIEVRLQTKAARDAVPARVAERLSGRARVVTPEARERNVAGLLAAFRLNLTALSLISLFVGLFLVHESIQASLVRRRAEFGLLRCLGATRGQVARILLAETACLGLLGTALGLPMGRFAASFAVGPVSATLTNVYLVNEIENLKVGVGLYALAVAIGVGGALLGGLGPALEMAGRDARTLLLPFALHERAERLAGPLAAAGLVLLGGGAAWFFWFGHRFHAGGFVLAFLLLAALPLLTPRAVQLAGQRRPARSFGWTYSLRTLVLRLHTTSFAIAALAVSVSMLVAVTLLVGSFRKTLETWVLTTLRADVYITTESWARGSGEAGLDAPLLAELTGFHGVQEAEVLRQTRVWSGDTEITISGVGFAPSLPALRIPLRKGDPASALRRVRDQGWAMISEPLSRKRSLSVGDSLVLETDKGPVLLPIAAVSYDYSSDAGNAVVSRATLDRMLGPGPITNVALFLEPGTDPGTIVAELKNRYADRPLLIRSNADLRREIFRIFDQTFAVTRLLQVMALLVAALGISLALLVIARERRSELALYRALGALRHQLVPLLLYEALGMGILGLVLGVAAGIGLASLLIHVINPAYFGWTIRASWPWTELLQEAATILSAAVLAGLPVALRASRMPAEDLARDAV